MKMNDLNAGQYILIEFINLDFISIYNFPHLLDIWNEYCWFFLPCYTAFNPFDLIKAKVQLAHKVINSQIFDELDFYFLVIKFDTHLNCVNSNGAATATGDAGGGVVGNTCIR